MRRHLPRLGHPLFDRQHARLADDTRALIAALRRGAAGRCLLSRLIRDSRRHFASEERLMRQLAERYPEAEGHRALHRGLLEDMLRLRATLAGGGCLHHRHGQLLFEALAHHADAADRNLVAAWRRTQLPAPRRATHGLAERHRRPRPGL